MKRLLGTFLTLYGITVAASCFSADPFAKIRSVFPAGSQCSTTNLLNAPACTWGDDNDNVQAYVKGTHVYLIVHRAQSISRDTPTAQTEKKLQYDLAEQFGSFTHEEYDDCFKQETEFGFWNLMGFPDQQDWSHVHSIAKDAYTLYCAYAIDQGKNEFFAQIAWK
jgi:hypothetical protein